MVLVLEFSGGLTDVHYFIILYNVQNTLNIKKIQAKEEKEDEHGMDPDRSSMVSLPHTVLGFQFV